MTNSSVKVPTTAPLVAAGLIGGFVVARVTKVRWLGGVVFSAAGAAAATSWARTLGPVPTAALSAGYAAAMGLSHPLAKKVGAWPAVVLVTAAATGAAVWADVRAGKDARPGVVGE